MTVRCDDGFINIRAGAVIMKDGRFLMVGSSRFDYLYSVGGRIRFGETAEEAVVREVFEETGVKMEIDRLGFVNEKLRWVSPEEDVTVYPVFLKGELSHPENAVKHFVSDERNCPAVKIEKKCE